jgi:hypothetical protein
MALPVLQSAWSKLFALVLVVTVFAACNKEKPTTVAIIVKMENGAVVEGAYVKLYANPAVPLGDQTRLIKEATTNASGRAEFDYSEFYKKGQSGFAVLDILTTKDTLEGRGLIKVLEEEHNEETVFLLPPQ